MNLYGFSDSLADHCENPCRLRAMRLDGTDANGLCLGCLLQPALEGEGSNGERFAAVLGEIDTPRHGLASRQLSSSGGDRTRRDGGDLSRAATSFPPHRRAETDSGYHADSRETLARFRREAEAAASLDHPNILPIYEVGEGEDGAAVFQHEIRAGWQLARGRTRLAE